MPDHPIGGNGERRILRLVARHADMCNVFGSPEEVERKFAAPQAYERTGTHYVIVKILAAADLAPSVSSPAR